MKKFSISPKGKKIAVLAGAVIFCGGVLATVLATTASAGISTQDSSSSTASTASLESRSLTIAPIEGPSSSASSVYESKSGTAFDPKKESSRSEPLTSAVSKPSKPASKPPKPVVKGDSKSGSKPTNPVLTNKPKKPTYTTTPKAQTPTKKKSSSTSTPKAGGTTDKNGGSSGGNHAGELYDPAFGWIKDEGGGGQGTVLDGDGDINKQVGIAD